MKFFLDKYNNVVVNISADAVNSYLDDQSYFNYD